MKNVIRVKNKHYSGLKPACKDNGGKYETVKGFKFPFDHKGKTYEKIKIKEVITNSVTGKKYYFTVEEKRIKLNN